MIQLEKTEYDAKIKGNEDKIPDDSIYVTAKDLHKFSGIVFCGKTKTIKFRKKSLC